MVAGSRSMKSTFDWSTHVRRAMAREYVRKYGRPRPTSIVTEEEDGQLCWGGPVEWPGRSGINWDGMSDNNTDEEDQNQEEQKCTKAYTEKSRKTTDVRVENPDDKSQYVIVERINEIEFSGNDGCSHKFTLNWN